MPRFATIVLIGLMMAGWARADDSTPAPADAAQDDRSGQSAGGDGSNSTTPGQTSNDDKSHWLVDAVDAQKKQEEAQSQQANHDNHAPRINPVAPYLSQWMTPQDYTLLGRSSTVPTKKSPLAIQPAAGTPALAAPANKAKPNPYLAGMDTLSTASLPPAGTSPAPVTAVKSPVPVSPPPPPAPPAPAASMPANDDSKYFPELKNRF
jgi:hypothetical protein